MLMKNSKNLIAIIALLSTLKISVMVSPYRSKQRQVNIDSQPASNCLDQEDYLSKIIRYYPTLIKNYDLAIAELYFKIIERVSYLQEKSATEKKLSIGSIDVEELGLKGLDNILINLIIQFNSDSDYRKLDLTIRRIMSRLQLRLLVPKSQRIFKISINDFVSEYPKQAGKLKYILEKQKSSCLQLTWRILPFFDKGNFVESYVELYQKHDLMSNVTEYNIDMEDCESSLIISFWFKENFLSPTASSIMLVRSRGAYMQLKMISDNAKYKYQLIANDEILKEVRLNESCTQWVFNVFTIEPKGSASHFTFRMLQVNSGELLEVTWDTENFNLKSILVQLRKTQLAWYLKSHYPKSLNLHTLISVEVRKDFLVKDQFCGSTIDKCAYSNEGICLKCNENVLMAYNGVCVERCPITAYLEMISQKCIDCQLSISNCSTCKSKSECISCLPNFHLLSGFCFGTCPKGYYIQNTEFGSTCLQCESNCSECTSSAKCNFCKVPYVSQNGKCVKDCHAGYFEKNSVCEKCDSSCFYCANLNECTKCGDDTFLLNSKCLSSCPLSYYSNQITRECIICPAGCSKCSERDPSSSYLNPLLKCDECLKAFDFNSSTHLCHRNCSDSQCSKCKVPNCFSCSRSIYECEECNEGHYSLNGFCLDTCPLGYYAQKRICSECNLGCSVCLDKYQCLQCVNTHVLLNGVCVLSCPDYYYPKNGLCVQCSDSKCKKCIENGSLCSNCDELMTLNSKGNCINCLSLNGQGYFLDGNFNCKSCPVGCMVCNETGCLSCIEGFKIYSSIVCMEQCPSGYFEKNGRCINCLIKNCQTCLNDEELCYQCKKGYVKFLGECIEECPETFFENDQSECARCALNCEKCNAHQCLKCKEGYLLNNGQCSDSCPPSLEPSEILGKCVEPNFKVCQNDQFLLEKFICVHFCPQGYFADNQTQECSKCSTQCLSCSGISLCKSCVPGFKLESGTCKGKCSSGQFYNSEGNICISCTDEVCENCNSFGYCLNCKSPYLNQNGKCVTSCNKGFYPNHKDCSPCSKSCGTCRDSSTDCLTCNSSNYFYSLKYKSKCMQTCPPSTALIINIDTNERECFDCLDSDCEICDSSNLAKCKLCSRGLLIQNGRCVAKCDAGFFENAFTKSCNPIEISGCMKQVNNMHRCLLCENGKLLSYYQDACVDKCESGYKADFELRVCAKCLVFNCVTCDDNIYSCSKCNEGFKLIGNSCIPCLNNICSCPSNCAECSNSGCLICKPNYFLNLGKCEGYKGCEMNKCICENPNCIECLPYSPSICLACKIGSFLVDFDCVTSKRCNEAACIKCDRSNNNACLECLPNYSSNDGKCLSSCTEKETSALCTPCKDKNCNSCSSTAIESCLSCNTGLVLFNSECVYSCPKNFYYLNYDFKCMRCSQNCKKCSSVEICDTCDEGYVSVSVNGYLLCTKHCSLTMPFEGHCSICPKNCDECIYGTCIKCQDGYRLANNLCERQVIPQYDLFCIQTNSKGVCNSCSANHSLINGICIENTCKSAEYYDSASMKCKKCSTNCIECTSQYSCVTCSKAAFKRKLKSVEFCVEDCGPNFFGDEELMQCIECNDSKCSSCDKSKCKTCQAPYYLQATEVGTVCTFECFNGYYESGRICKACPKNCSSCDMLTCYSCILSHALSPSNKCVLSCDSGYYKAFDSYSNIFRCRQCSSLCLKCEDKTGTCLECQPNYTLVNDECIPDCIDCNKCTIADCLKCNRNQNKKCEACGNNFYLSAESTCQNKCGVNTYPAKYGSELTCELCNDPDCSDCDFQKCFACRNNKLNFRGRCVSNCPLMHFANQLGGCETCSPNCLICVSKDICLQCESGFSNLNNECIASCPERYYRNLSAILLFNSFQLTCMPCPPGCLACISGDTCQVCEAQLKLQDGRCTQICSTNYVNVDFSLQLISSSQCLFCDVDCEECSGLNPEVCLRCRFPLILKRGKCVLECGIGFTKTYLSCEACQDPDCMFCDKGECLQCFNGLFLHDSECLDSCPTGYRKSDGKCEKCLAEGCDECKENADSCTTCAQDMLSMITTEGKRMCVKDCGRGYFQRGSHICDKCKYPCEECHDENICNSCVQNFDLLAGKCNSRCDEAQAFIDGKCYSCGANCLLCNTLNLNQCLVCKTGFLHNDECVGECPNGHFENNGACTSCSLCNDHLSCLQCTLGNPKVPEFPGLMRRTTSLCQIEQDKMTGILKEEGSCVTTCSNGYYLEEKSRECLKCKVAECKYCVGGARLLSTNDGITCIECHSGFYLHHNKCISKCPFSYLESRSKCIKCPKNCEICSEAQPQVCLKCSPSLALYNNNCLYECPEGFIKDKFGQCLKCPDKCIKCSFKDTSIVCDECFPASQTIISEHGCNSSRPKCIDQENCKYCDEINQCTECRNELILFNSNCIKTCPIGFYKVGNICLKCMENCKACLNPFECIECQAGYYLTQSKQCDACLSQRDIIIKSKFCGQCSLSCRTCLANTTNFCTSCRNEKKLHLGTCLENCPAGYFDEEYTCKVCPNKCSSCLSSSICLKCQDNFLNQEGVCAKNCSSGYFSYNSICYPCSKGCVTCNEKACEICDESFFNWEGKCISECPFGFVTRLVNSVKHCATCNSVFTNCLSCNEDECIRCKGSLVISSKGECVDSCSTTEFVNENLKCKSCGDSCSKCSSSKNNYCNACEQGKLLIDGQCVRCMEGYYMNLSKCLQCPKLCRHCNEEGCVACVKGYFLSLSKKECLKSCPLGQTSLANVCSKCEVSECDECESNNLKSCNKCKPNLFNYKNTCIKNCPPSTFSDNFGNCQDCPAACKSCLNSAECLECKPSLVLSNGFCKSDCPKGFFNSNGKCSNCQISNCSSCIIGSCLRCNIPYYLFNGKCVYECPDSYRKMMQIPSLRKKTVTQLKSNPVTLAAESNDLSQFQCIECPKNCMVCDDRGQCTFCNENYFLTEKGSCEQACEAGYYSDCDKRKCNKCREGCVACNSGSNCLLCDSGRYKLLSLQRDTMIESIVCVTPEECPGSTFQNANESECTACGIPNCDICSGRDTCSKCSFNFKLSADQTECFLDLTSESFTPICGPARRIFSYQDSFMDARDKNEQGLKFLVRRALPQSIYNNFNMHLYPLLSYSVGDLAFGVNFSSDSCFILYFRLLYEKIELANCISVSTTHWTLVEVALAKKLDAGIISLKVERITNQSSQPSTVSKVIRGKTISQIFDKLGKNLESKISELIVNNKQLLFEVEDLAMLNYFPSFHRAHHAMTKYTPICDDYLCTNCQLNQEGEENCSSCLSSNLVNTRNIPKFMLAQSFLPATAHSNVNCGVAYLDLLMGENKVSSSLSWVKALSSKKFGVSMFFRLVSELDVYDLIAIFYEIEGKTVEILRVVYLKKTSSLKIMVVDQEFTVNVDNKFTKESSSWLSFNISVSDQSIAAGVSRVDELAKVAYKSHELKKETDARLLNETVIAVGNSASKAKFEISSAKLFLNSPISDYILHNEISLFKSKINVPTDQQVAISWPSSLIEIKFGQNSAECTLIYIKPKLVSLFLTESQGRFDILTSTLKEPFISYESKQFFINVDGLCSISNGSSKIIGLDSATLSECVVISIIRQEGRLVLEIHDLKSPSVSLATVSCNLAEAKKEVKQFTINADLLIEAIPFIKTVFSTRGSKVNSQLKQPISNDSGCLISDYDSGMCLKCINSEIGQLRCTETEALVDSLQDYFTNLSSAINKKSISSIFKVTPHLQYFLSSVAIQTWIYVGDIEQKVGEQSPINLVEISGPGLFLTVSLKLSVNMKLALKLNKLQAESDKPFPQLSSWYYLVIAISKAALTCRLHLSNENLANPIIIISIINLYPIPINSNTSIVLLNSETVGADRHKNRLLAILFKPILLLGDSNTVAGGESVPNFKQICDTENSKCKVCHPSIPYICFKCADSYILSVDNQCEFGNAKFASQPSRMLADNERFELPVEHFKSNFILQFSFARIYKSGDLDKLTAHSDQNLFLRLWGDTFKFFYSYPNQINVQIAGRNIGKLKLKSRSFFSRYFMRIEFSHVLSRVELKLLYAGQVISSAVESISKQLHASSESQFRSLNSEIVISQLKVLKDGSKESQSSEILQASLCPLSCLICSDDHICMVRASRFYSTHYINSTAFVKNLFSFGTLKSKGDWSAADFSLSFIFKEESSSKPIFAISAGNAATTYEESSFISYGVHQSNNRDSFSVKVSYLLWDGTRHFSYYTLRFKPDKGSINCLVLSFSRAQRTIYVQHSSIGEGYSGAKTRFIKEVVQLPESSDFELINSKSVIKFFSDVDQLKISGHYTEDFERSSRFISQDSFNFREQTLTREPKSRIFLKPPIEHSEWIEVKDKLYTSTNSEVVSRGIIQDIPDTIELKSILFTLVRVVKDKNKLRYPQLIAKLGHVHIVETEFSFVILANLVQLQTLGVQSCLLGDLHNFYCVLKSDYSDLSLNLTKLECAIEIQNGRIASVQLQQPSGNSIIKLTDDGPHDIPSLANLLNPVSGVFVSDMKYSFNTKNNPLETYIMCKENCKCKCDLSLKCPKLCSVLDPLRVSYSLNQLKELPLDQFMKDEKFGDLSSPLKEFTLEVTLTNLSREKSFSFNLYLSGEADDSPQLGISIHEQKFTFHITIASNIKKSFRLDVGDRSDIVMMCSYSKSSREVSLGFIHKNVIRLFEAEIEDLPLFSFSLMKINTDMLKADLELSLMSISTVFTNKHEMLFSLAKNSRNVEGSIKCLPDCDLCMEVHSYICVVCMPGYSLIRGKCLK